MSLLNYLSFLIARVLQGMIAFNNLLNGLTDGILTALESIFSKGSN